MPSKEIFRTRVILKANIRAGIDKILLIKVVAKMRAHSQMAVKVILKLILFKKIKMSIA